MPPVEVQLAPTSEEIEATPVEEIDKLNRLCEKAVPSMISSGANTRCAEHFIANAKRSLASKDGDTAAYDLDLANPFLQAADPADPRVRQVSQSYKKLLPKAEQAKRLSAKEQAKTGPKAVADRAGSGIGSQGSRSANLDAIVAQLSPLFTGYEVVGPVSVRMNLEPEVWRRLDRDQQQQLGDMLASKDIVQSMKTTLHLYVHETEVGAIGPGWGGQWKFRRAQ